MYSSLSKVFSSVTRIIALIFAVAIVYLTAVGKLSAEQFIAFAFLVLNHFFLTSLKQTVDKSSNPQ